jgi:histidinol-phosphate aminotransferase
MNAATGSDIEHLARAAALAIEPYTWEIASETVAARYGLQPDEVVRYDTNTAPLPPPSASDVLAQLATAPVVNEYVDGSYGGLARGIGLYTGFGPEHLVIGAGADEVIDVLAKTFLEAGDRVVIPSPTYSLYRIVAQTMGAQWSMLPARMDLSFDMQGLAAAGREAKAIFLCNPNNPTGRTVSIEEIETLVRAVSGLVIVDEAYAEFAGITALPLVRQLPRLVVVRTLSKAFALAGARVGYAVCHPEVAALANRMRPPNSISTAGVLLGEAALRDLPAMRATVQALTTQRDLLAEALAEMSRAVVPSSANFVLARWPSAAAAAATHAYCLQRGLVVRSYPDHPVLADHLRVTARTPEQTARVIAALRAA